MASLAYILSGAAPVIKKFQFGVTLTNPGIPFTIPASNTAGVVIGTTTGATDLVGFSLDTGMTGVTGAAASTFTTTQGTGDNSAYRVVSLVINPDAAWKFMMSGGATEGTALSTQTATSASSGGTAVTTATDWSSPTTYDEGYVWGLTGANAGAARKITSVSSTAGTVTIPFDYAIAVGDTFLRCPYTPMQGTTVQLTTNLYQADASIAVATGAPFRTTELILRDGSDLGATNSFVVAVSNSHALRLA